MQTVTNIPPRPRKRQCQRITTTPEQWENVRSWVVPAIQHCKEEWGTYHAIRLAWQISETSLSQIINHPTRPMSDSMIERFAAVTRIDVDTLREVRNPDWMTEAPTELEAIVTPPGERQADAPAPMGIAQEHVSALVQVALELRELRQELRDGRRATGNLTAMLSLALGKLGREGVGTLAQG